MKHTRSLVALASVGLVAGCSSGQTSLTPQPSSPTTASAFVFTETNATSGNAVLAFARAANGSLARVGAYATGGQGIGLPTSGLPFPIGGATGAVALAPNGAVLYAVDAGSDDVAAFSIGSTGALTPIGRYPTNGTSPASITIDPTGRYLYVLNTGSVPTGANTPGGITGFTIAAGGALAPIANSTQPVSSSSQYVDPSEVRFSSDGSYLVATEKATSLIDIYPVIGGVAGAPVSNASTGKIPFGFAVAPNGTLVVANAASTSSDTAASLSSYTANAAGTLAVVSGQVGDDQGAACWVSLTSTGTYAYASNTLTGNISGYAVSGSGALTLLTAGGATGPQAATTGPIDDVVAPGNGYLYVLDSMAGKAPGTIAGWAIAANGSLTPISTNVSGLVPGTIGLAAR